MQLICRLELDFCSGLRQLPASLGGLSNLADLDLMWCDGLEQLPEQLQGLAALTRLNLDGCERLSSLPPGVTALTGTHASISRSGTAWNRA